METDEDWRQHLTTHASESHAQEERRLMRNEGSRLRPGRQGAKSQGRVVLREENSGEGKNCNAKIRFSSHQ